MVNAYVNVSMTRRNTAFTGLQSLPAGRLPTSNPPRIFKAYDRDCYTTDLFHGEARSHASYFIFASDNHDPVVLGSCITCGGNPVSG